MNITGSFFGMYGSYLNQGRLTKYTTKRPKRSEEFVAESKELAEQKRQRRCERNLRLARK